MSKVRTIYNCSSCEYQTIKWLGCCPGCKAWNTFNEAVTTSKKINSPVLELSYLSEIESREIKRMQTQFKEFDRVTGGGIVPGSFLVLTGDPGIGKSTLLLQIASSLAECNKTFYFSTEESLAQVKLRAERLNCSIDNSMPADKLLFSDQANLDDIIAVCQKEKPQVIIIDSIQNCYIQSADSIPGSIGQLKEAAFKLMRLSKEHNIAIIASGHITKEGVIAGPKTLEHIVDAVFYLQSEDRWQVRALRSVKNRFGTVNEIGFFQMGSSGLEEFANINQQLLGEISHNPGSILLSFIEGTRPILLELQALVVSSKYGIPQRVISGIDQTQVVLIAAIIEKYLKVNISSQDIFFKISGGFKIKSSAADLAIALALLSSYFQKPLPEKSLALGEISLTGQIKPINLINIHVAEAEKFGIDTLLIAHNQTIDTQCKKIKLKNIYDLLSLFE